MKGKAKIELRLKLGYALTTLSCWGIAIAGINSYYMGSFLHADDIRTLAIATSAESLQSRWTLWRCLWQNTSSNLMLRNVKWYIVFMRSHQEGTPVCEVEGTFLLVSDTLKCLRVLCRVICKIYWWEHQEGKTGPYITLFMWEGGGKVIS